MFTFGTTVMSNGRQEKIIGVRTKQFTRLDTIGLPEYKQPASNKHAGV